MIGREKEVKELLDLYNSNKAQFIAVYGRRRVGKTYLINETFQNKITFHHAGLSPIEETKSKSLLKSQLEQFYYSILQHGMKKSHRPTSWLEAFFMLEMFLQEKDNGERQVIFIDELHWLDTPKSGFITALEGFWNNWCASRHNIMLIVCGSASSWIQDKLINNHGGSYGRVTYKIKLNPFTLKECDKYFRSLDIRLSRYDIVQSYMMLGGIPYYLGYFEKNLSLAQNIDNLFYIRNAKLKDEYNRLFSSIFSNSEYMKSIIEFLYTRSIGYTKKEILEELGIIDGGTFSEALRVLIESDFIIKYVPFGANTRETHYKLIDPFCIYALHFVKNQEGRNEEYWQSKQESQSVISWRGFAFELVCFNHINQIKKALGISGVLTTHSAYIKKGDDTQGFQIDLIIERNDNVINICEIKFTSEEFLVNKDYYKILLSRPEKIREMVSKKRSIHTTLITTFGLKYNEYSSAFTNVITLDDLF